MDKSFYPESVPLGRGSFNAAVTFLKYQRQSLDLSIQSLQAP